MYIYIYIFSTFLDSKFLYVSRMVWTDANKRGTKQKLGVYICCTGKNFSVTKKEFSRAPMAISFKLSHQLNPPGRKYHPVIAIIIPEGTESKIGLYICKLDETIQFASSCDAIHNFSCKGEVFRQLDRTYLRETYSYFCPLYYNASSMKVRPLNCFKAHSQHIVDVRSNFSSKKKRSYPLRICEEEGAYVYISYHLLY